MPSGYYIREDPIIRFLRYVYKTNTCWLWTASLNGVGYGQFWFKGKLHKAHRWSFEYHIRPIKELYVIDHLCSVRNCVNPAHLEEVTFSENTKRSNILRASKRGDALNVFRKVIQ